MRLNRKFFNRDTVDVAKELLGRYLVRRIGGKIVKAKIIETEAYCGIEDKACHASKGLTPRTKVMFGPAGFTYVYLIYGMYHCLNIVTEKKGYPAAVLIRGCELIKLKARNSKFEINSKNKKSKFKSVSDFDIRISNFKLNGPGKVCRKLKIDRTLNNINIATSKDMWIEDFKEPIKPNQIKKTKRIGVDYAGKWKDKLWRFYI